MTTPRKVDWRNDEDCILAGVMGTLGYSTKYIAERTGLTKFQIQYRLGLKGIKRSDFRNGNSTASDHLLNSQIAANVRRNIRET